MTGETSVYRSCKAQRRKAGRGELVYPEQRPTSKRERVDYFPTLRVIPPDISIPGLRRRVSDVIQRVKSEIREPGSAVNAGRA